jgi:hypothetical protein
MRARSECVLVALFIAACGCALAHPAPQWHAWRSPDFGFALQVPPGMQAYSMYPRYPLIGDVPDAMIPVCARESVACFLFPVTALAHSTISALGMSVNVYRDLRTAEACNAVLEGDGSRDPTKRVAIHGVEFQSAETGDAATSHSAGYEVYRTFHSGVCFEISIGTSSIDVSPEEYADLGITAGNPPNLKEMDKQLHRMLASFRFVGPILDGADWLAYHGFYYGESFEYPAESKVEVTARFRTIWAEQFTAGGRTYKILRVEFHRHNADDIFGYGDAPEEWFPQHGYPGIKSGLKVLESAPQYTEYAAGPYIYFRFRDGMDFYILGMTDADGNPLPPGNDRVFGHLLRTFNFD